MHPLVSLLTPPASSTTLTPCNAPPPPPPPRAPPYTILPLTFPLASSPPSAAICPPTLAALSPPAHAQWRKCVTLEASLGLLDELSALAEAPTRVEAAINCRDWHAAVTHLLDAFAKLARPEFQQVSTAIRQVLMDVAAVWEVLQSHLLQEVHAAIYGSALAAVAGADDAGLAARMALLGGGGGRAGGGGVGGGGLPQRTASQSYLAALASPAATPRKGLSAAGGGGAAALGLLTPAGGRVGGAGGRAGGATMQQLGARRREMLMETPGGPRCGGGAASFTHAGFASCDLRMQCAVCALHCDG